MNSTPGAPANTNSVRGRAITIIVALFAVGLSFSPRASHAIAIEQQWVA
jgi:hypothetical protein